MEDHLKDFKSVPKLKFYFSQFLLFLISNIHFFNDDYPYTFFQIKIKSI